MKVPALISRSLAVLFVAGLWILPGQIKNDGPKGPDTTPSTVPKNTQDAIGAAVDPNKYALGSEDVIFIKVWREQDFTGSAAVRPDGKISMGFYGEVFVAGLTIPEAKEKIVLHLRKYLSDDALGLNKYDEEGQIVGENAPADSDRVFVDVTAYNSKYYYVQGDVAAPGRLPITGNETVLDAINFAGGLIPTAAHRTHHV